MKSKELYLVINEIDDDLIESAMVINSVQKIIPVKRYMAFVACFCMMILGVLSISKPATNEIHINEIQGLMMKSIDVDMKLWNLSEAEIKNYFSEFTFPSERLLNFTLDQQNQFVFLVDEQNNIYDDGTVFTYRNDSQIVEIKLSKIGIGYGYLFNDDMKKKISYIDGQEVLIGSYTDYKMDQDVIEIKKYVAELKYKNIYITINSENITQELFIDMLEEVIDLNRE